jgi:dUTPase
MHSQISLELHSEQPLGTPAIARPRSGLYFRRNRSRMNQAGTVSPSHERSLIDAATQPRTLSTG